MSLRFGAHRTVAETPEIPDFGPIWQVSGDPKIGHFEAKTAEIGVYLDPKIGHFEAKTGEFGVPKRVPK